MKREYVITIMLLAVLAAYSAPSAMGACTCDVATHGCPCACGTNGTVDGTVYVKESHEYPADKTHFVEFYVPDGTIKWARVYWTIWGGNDAYTGWSNATFCNANGCWENKRYIDDSCTQSETDGWYKGGSGSHFVYWNVTNKVSIGDNNLTVNQTLGGWPSGNYGTCSDIIVVVVIDNIDGYPETNYWINQGYDLPTNTKATWFNGPVNTSTNHTLHHYAYGDNDDWTLLLNDAEVESYDKGAYRPMETVEIDSSLIDSDNTQKMEWDPWESYFHPNLAIMVGNDRFFNHPDLEVGEMKVNEFNNSCPDQTPTGLVVDHSYDVEVEIKNTGGLSTGSSFSVTLYDDDTPVETNSIAALGGRNSTWTMFNWTPASHGSHTLKAFADSSRVIPEDIGEGNNNGTLVKDVLAFGQADLDATGCIDFMPAWQCNKTNVVVTVLNNGTGDTGNFNVRVTVRNATTGTQIWQHSETISMCAKAQRELVFNAAPDLTRHYDYNVTVELDSLGQVTESDDNNNNETKYFHAIGVKLMVSHHFGDMSDYNGQLSDYNTAKMFRIDKIVTNYTTPEKLLESEADVTSGSLDPPYVYGINRSDTQGTSAWYMNRSANETETCNLNRFIYWYCLINGIQTPAMPTAMDTYLLDDGESMRMDLLKYVNSGGESGTHFKPRPIMDFPEPFLHGYNGTVWSTTIVYPTSNPGGNYATLATNIQNRLIAEGVTNVNVTTNATLTPTEKQNNHLILLGTPTENSIIDEINAGHTEVGMPAYFDTSNPNAIRLYDDWLYPDCCSLKNSGYHSIIMACDNPFNNAAPWTDTWMDANQTVWIASGVTTYYAKDAANVLASGNLGDKGFWNKTRKCGDINGDGTAGAMSDAFAIVFADLRTSEWAADVNCDSTAGAMSDAFDIVFAKLNCCSDC